jgi:hypothetical protein
LSEERNENFSFSHSNGGDGLQDRQGREIVLRLNGADATSETEIRLFMVFKMAEFQATADSAT